MNFLTNFRPVNTNTNSNIFLRLKIKNRIMSKNFILFLLLIKYIKNKNNFLNFSFFIKPNFTKSSVILRAPYKNKLSRHNLVYNRYNLLVKFSLNLNELVFINSLNNLNYLIKKFKSFFLWFESNICYQHKIKFIFNINYKNNFLLKKY